MVLLSAQFPVKHLPASVHLRIQRDRLHVCDGGNWQGSASGDVPHSSQNSLAVRRETTLVLSFNVFFRTILAARKLPDPKCGSGAARLGNAFGNVG